MGSIKQADRPGQRRGDDLRLASVRSEVDFDSPGGVHHRVQ